MAGSWRQSHAVVCISVMCAIFVQSREERGRALLACILLVLQDRVDVVHFAQPLEEGDEVQQLCVGHVVEPRGHGHLDHNAESRSISGDFHINVDDSDSQFHLCKAHVGNIISK